MNDTTAPQKPIHVLTIGMDRRKQAMFRMAFEMHTLHRYQLLEGGAEGAPDLAIIDFDTPDSTGLWNEFSREYPNLPVLIVTTIANDNVPAPVLLKPIRLESLFPQLRRLLATPAPKHTPVSPPGKTGATGPVAATTAPVTTEAAPTAAPTPEPEQPAEESALPVHAWPARLGRFDPRIGLLGTLLKIKRSQTPAVVSIAGVKSIIVLPTHDRALLLQPESSFKQICMNPATLVITTPLSSEDQIDAKSVSLNTLLWQISLWTSRGRLLAGFPEQGAVQLRYWPNLTRLAPTANALRIAAFWVRSPSTLPLTLRMLNIPASEIFDFLAASYCIGILDVPRMPAKPTASKIVTDADASKPAPVSTAPRKVVQPAAMAVTEKTITHTPPQPARGGLLSRLLRKVAGL